MSCQGENNYGGYALTLVDLLDTLVVLNQTEDFRKSVTWLIDNLRFDTDLNVSVFETTIRVLGGLLSGHFLAQDADLELFPGYQGQLLSKAVDLADRLLPAFQTPTGIPFGTVNLKHGVPIGETVVANVASAGTLILEWGLLSRLTGDPKYEAVAKRSLDSVWAKRSKIDLVGTHIDITTGEWTEHRTGIGAGVDSVYEYMLKGYIMFRDPTLMDMFNKSYNAVMKYQNKAPWYADVNMMSGAVTSPVFNSLAAFWPGLQTMIGDYASAAQTLKAYFQVWRRYGFVPEGFNFVTNDVHEGQVGYPLRPEMAESAWYLYQVHRDPIWLQAGADMVDSIENRTKVACGYAAVHDVRSHTLSDFMDSYFLAETLKYLFLLFDEDNWLLQHYGGFVFTTEAHLLPLHFEEKKETELPSSDKASNSSLFFTCSMPSLTERLTVQDLKRSEFHTQHPRSTDAPSALEAMHKFSAFAQQLLDRIPPKELRANALNGKVVVRFADPMAAYRRFTSSGQLVFPIGYGGSSNPTERTHEQDIKYAKLVLSGIHEGLPKGQQQQLIDLVRHGEVVVAVEEQVGRSSNSYASTLKLQRAFGSRTEPRTIDSVAGPFGQFEIGGTQVSGLLQSADPVDGCTSSSPLTEHPYEDAVVLMPRGGCSFVVKIHMAQLAGAKGVVVYNRLLQSGGHGIQQPEEAFVMGPDPDHADKEAAIAIPTATISAEEGENLMDQLKVGPVPITLSLVADKGQRGAKMLLAAQGAVV